MSKCILLSKIPLLIQTLVELAIFAFKFPGHYCAKKCLCMKELILKFLLA